MPPITITCQRRLYSYDVRIAIFTKRERPQHTCSCGVAHTQTVNRSVRDHHGHANDDDGGKDNVDDEYKDGVIATMNTMKSTISIFNATNMDGDAAATAANTLTATRPTGHGTRRRQRQ